MPGRDISFWSGKIIEAKPEGNYRVELDNGRIVTACASGELRMHYVRLIPGDTVVVEIEEDAATIGQIIARMC